MLRDQPFAPGGHYSVTLAMEPGFRIIAGKVVALDGQTGLPAIQVELLARTPRRTEWTLPHGN